MAMGSRLQISKEKEGQGWNATKWWTRDLQSEWPGLLEPFHKHQADHHKQPLIPHNLSMVTNDIHVANPSSQFSPFLTWHDFSLPPIWLLPSLCFSNTTLLWLLHLTGDITPYFILCSLFLFRGNMEATCWGWWVTSGDGRSLSSWMCGEQPLASPDELNWKRNKPLLCETSMMGKVVYYSS